MLLTMIYILITYFLTKNALAHYESVSALKFFFAFGIGSSLVYLLEQSLRNVLHFDIKNKNKIKQ